MTLYLLNYWYVGHQAWSFKQIRLLWSRWHWWFRAYWILPRPCVVNSLTFCSCQTCYSNASWVKVRMLWKDCQPSLRSWSQWRLMQSYMTVSTIFSELILCNQTLMVCDHKVECRSILHRCDFIQLLQELKVLVLKEVFSSKVSAFALWLCFTH